MSGEPTRPGLCGRVAALHPALLLLCGRREHAGAHDGEGLRRAWLALGLLGVAWGFALAGVWSLVGLRFRQWPGGLPLAHALAVLLAIGLGPFRQALFALADRLGSGDGGARGTMGALVLLVLTLCLLQIDPGQAESSAWFRPYGPLRPLLLMPVWGAWAMMVPGHFAPPAEDACPLVRSFVRNQPMAATAAWMALPLAATLWQFDFLGYGVILPAALPLLAGGLVGPLWCRLGGGVRRGDLLAANMLAQVALLIGYVAAKAS